MNKWLGMMVLTGLTLLLATCGGSAPTTEPEVVVESANDVQRITQVDSKVLLDGGEAVLYDTRSAAAYQAAHAAGAISFPEAEAATRYGELPSENSLIFY